MPPGHISGLAALGLQFTVCGPGGGGGGGGGGGPGPGLSGHGHAGLPHCGHLMPPGQSWGFFAFGSHMIGLPPPLPVTTAGGASRARRPPLSCAAAAAAPGGEISVIWHSTLVRLPFVPQGGTVATVRWVMTTLSHFLALARSASVKLPSSDHSVPFETTADLPSDHRVEAGRPGSGPVGTAGGGPGAAATPTTLHFHVNG
jgi:hypothetical protein